MRPGARLRRGVNPDAATPATHGVTLIPALGADGGLFAIEKLQAHVSGQLHLAVSIFLFSGEEMLIQRRAAAKYHCGGLWANSCCTHPNWGESLIDAAHRRLGEELGARVALEPRGTLTYRAAVGSGLIEHEQVQVFRAEVDRSRFALAPNPAEVMETAWISRRSLAAAMAARPQDFAPWFHIYIERWESLGFDAVRQAAE